MKQVKKIIIGLAVVLSGFFSNSQAQYGMDMMGMDPMMGMQVLMNQMDMRVAQDAMMMDQMMLDLNQRQALAEQQYMQAVMQQQIFYTNYYRQHTGDRTTPDHMAAQLGNQLYCQHNPAECQQHAAAMNRISARGHQQRMNDIASWGNTMNQVAQTNSDILDMNYHGYMQRSEMQSQGQANYVQGAIYGESTYMNQSGMGYSLPVYPNQSSYTAPDGTALYFDYNTSTWYQWDGYGSWLQLQEQR